MDKGVRGMGERLRSSREVVSLIAVVSIFSGLLGCSVGPDQVGQKEAQGQQAGTLIGGMIGNYIPGGTSVAGQVIKSQSGTIGGLVGSKIGAALDEEDRQALARATRAAFVSGQPKTFSNKQTGVRGSARVAASRVNPGGQECRTVKQEVTLKDGTALSETVSACKGPNGWDV
jgi:surface antigen